VFSSEIHFSIGVGVLCLLLVALIGWLVGWLPGRLNKRPPVESHDAELAGKLHVFRDEFLRLQQENADLKTRINYLEFAAREREMFSVRPGEESDLSSAFAAIGERNRLRDELRELKEKLETYALMSRSARSSDDGIAGELWYDAARGLVSETRGKRQNRK
jgi:hypothetical protein